jgi:glucose-specific phosphotransferase system IIA component
MTLTIAAPTAGAVRPLSSVPDALFAQLMMGPGWAIEPRGGHCEVLCPVDGVVLSLQPHAFVVEADHDHSILVHLGLDTATLQGRGFDVCTSIGQRVLRGQTLLQWSPAAVVAAGLNPIVPVIALQAPPPTPRLLVTEGSDILAGQDLFTWD